MRWIVLLLMLPVHLAIGVMEGLATAAIIVFVTHARPEVLPTASDTGARVSSRSGLLTLVLAAVVTGGVASWFASTRPDGLEWSMFKVSGKEERDTPGGGIHHALAAVQEQTAFLPDYSFKAPEHKSAPAEQAAPETEPWPAVRAGTSVSGLLGGLLTLALVCLTGGALRMRGLPCRRGSEATK